MKFPCQGLTRTLLNMSKESDLDGSIICVQLGTVYRSAYGKQHAGGVAFQAGFSESDVDGKKGFWGSG